ncbi:hypothetical protein [Thauera sp.]|jgi:hypothetical protein|uniref:hypothetical protein n=1 Tax=Thauera sp. TaxID=1905334 RepID=UPI002A368395|nr:hypothetical protein [Thauera sp.]MDX9887192.1 hypothetical protein [Thauera sp.]
MQRAHDPLGHTVADPHRFVTANASQSSRRYDGSQALSKPRIADLVDDHDALAEWQRNVAKLREQHKA